MRASAQTGGELWSQPVNLSNSGSASRPAIAAEPNGTLHALWWDEFDGTQAAYFTSERGWSVPKTAPQITGGRTLVEGKSVRIPPDGLRLIASRSGWVHAFWLDSKRNLKYARSRSRSGSWALGATLATNPLQWDVTIDSDDVLHLAFIRSDNTQVLPAGVYYRTSPSDGAGWHAPVRVVASLYFRALPSDQAFVRVAADGQGVVLVAWDDAELRRSFYAWSADGGKSFEAPVPGGTIDQFHARRTRLIPLPNGPPGPGEFLRIWEGSEACALYQEKSLDRGLTWNTPLRVLDTLGDCPQSERPYPVSDGRVLVVLGSSNSRTTLVTWDGSRWSDPVALQVSFVDPTVNRPVNLECLDAVLGGEFMAAIGCDGAGDVWVTTSQEDLSNLLPALKTAWSPPVILSAAQGDAGVPAAAADAEGQVFALWSESAVSGQPGTSLALTSGDGVNWPGAITALRAPEGKAEMPALLADPGGMLHAVWSGGFAGEILYSRAFIRDVRSSSGWSEPRALPAPREVGGWPDLAMDLDGRLHAVYAIPLNEDRGVYYIHSEDQGQSWSEPRVVFDAAQAGWAMVRNTRLVVDGHGRLHVAWAKAALPEASTPLGVYYARSEDDGQTWSEPTEVSAGAFDQPRLVAATPDQIHMTWVGTTSAGLELWHRWSPDAGQTWSAAVRVLGLRNISAPDIGLATDGKGAVYLVGIERTRQNSAALFYLRWDGEGWVDRESMPLGYDPSEGSGATAVLLLSGRLGAFYRVRAPEEGGGARYIVGYTQRPVAVRAITPVPTFTPQALEAGPPTEIPAPTQTPLPTPDLTSVAPLTAGNTVWIQIGAVLIGIVLISTLAVARLWRGRRL